MTPAREPARGIRPAAALVGAVLAFSFVLTSLVIATLPQFQFESQLSAVLPFALWLAAPGIAALSVVANRVREPWVRAAGWVSVVPYAGLMLAEAAVPRLELPWWCAPAAALAAAVPFLVAAFRPSAHWPTGTRRSVHPSARNGVFWLVLALVLMTYAAASERLAGAIIDVLLAAALVVASLRRYGLADAARPWESRHWLSLLFGSVVVWAVELLSQLTTVFTQPWPLLAAVLLAGVPLFVAGRIRPAPVRS